MRTDAPARATSLLEEVADWEYHGADRITSVITANVPPTFPGRLVWWASELAPERVNPETIRRARLAIDCTCLHAYLHAIPGPRRDLHHPAATSVYASDFDAAILDGDYLLSRAFSTLLTAPDRSRAGSTAVRVLSQATVDHYGATVSSMGESSLARLTGAAADIGARLGGLRDDHRLEEVRQTADRLGHSVSYVMPRERPDVEGQDGADVTLATELGQTLADRAPSSRMINALLKGRPSR